MEENALAIALTRNARFQGSQTVVAQTLGRWADLYCSPSVYPVFPSFEPKPSPTFDSQVITDQRSGQCCHTCNTHDEKASFCLVCILKWDESVGWSFIIATSRSDSSSNKYNNRIICLPPGVLISLLLSIPAIMSNTSSTAGGCEYQHHQKRPQPRSFSTKIPVKTSDNENRQAIKTSHANIIGREVHPHENEPTRPRAKKEKKNSLTIIKLTLPETTGQFPIVK